MVKLSLNKIYYLIKFGKKDHLEKMLKNGDICFNPIEYFQKSKDKGVADYYEGIYELSNDEIETISCKHSLGSFEFKPVTNSKSRFVKFNDDPHLIFCTYSITENDIIKANNLFKIDNRMAEGYEWALIIKKPSFFIESIFNKIKQENLEYYKSDLIQYHDYSSLKNKELTFFDKDKEFEYQKEFRIIFKSSFNERKIISIGSIEEYCELVEAKYLSECSWSKKQF